MRAEETPYLPLVDALVKAVKILRSEKAIASEVLIGRIGGSRRTAYRALEALRRADLATEEAGRTVWREQAPIRTFESEAELTSHLLHSKLLIPAFKSLALISGLGRVTGSTGEYDQYAKCAQMHLVTAYPEIYKAYKQVEGMRAEILKLETRLLGEVRGRLGDRPGITFPENVAKAVYYDIGMSLTGHALLDFRVEGEDVKAGPYTLARRDVEDQVRKFIAEEEALLPNRKLCETILDVQNEFYRIRSGLEKEITPIVLKIENGTPLLGRCDLCPNLRLRVKARGK